MKLKHVLLSSAAVMMMAGAANAADLIVDVPADQPVAVAGTGWYLSVFAGGVWANSLAADDGSATDGQFFDFDTDMGWLVGATLGTHITDNLRGEVELSTGSVALTGLTIDDVDAGSISDGSASTTYLLGNVWFDIATGSGFTPYIGGGLGASYVTAKGTADDIPYTVDMAGWGWAYQLGAGVKVDVADNVALDLGYRFKSAVDVNLEGGGDDAVADLSSHVLQVGVTVGF
jgi:opacity protein-like surface antigen